MESFVLYHAWNEALRALHLDHLMHAEAPPRLQGLYLVSEQGLPISRAERPGFSEDPALLSMMLNNATEFVRDAIPAGGGQADGDLLRLASGGRGVIIARTRTVALIAVYEGRETEIFLREMERLLEEVVRRAGGRLDGWDGNKGAVADLAQPLTAALQSGSFDGVDMAADAQARRYNIFDNVLFGIRRRAAKQPMLVVLDDLQWADASSLALLHYVARNTRDAPVVLFGAFRTEERESRPQLREALVALAREDLGQEVAVLRLSPAESRAFAEGLLGAHEIAGEFFERLSTLTEGNPLILREVVRQLKSSGALAGGEGGGPWRLTRPVDKLEVSTRIRDAVSNRVATLGRPDRELIDAAAVCGTVFRGETLAAVVKAPEMEVARQLSAISRQHGVVVAQGDGWRFEHPVVREVVYDAVPGALRRLLHGAAGEWLVKAGGDPAQLGEHFAEAGDPRALEYLRQAATEAMERGAPAEAAHHFRKAASVAPAAERGKLSMEAARTLEMSGHHEEALEAIGRARAEGADAYEGAILQALVLAKLQRREEALSVVAANLPGASPSQSSRLLTLRARALVGLARYGEAEGAVHQALDHCPADDHAARADALEPLANVEWYRGRIDRSLELYNEALRLREAAGDRRGVAEVVMGMGGALAEAGEAQRSLEFLRLALTLSDRMGDRLLSATCHMNIAFSLLDLGDLDGSLDEAKRCLQAYEKLGDRRGTAWGELVTGMVLARRGQARGALSEMDRSIRRARSLGELRILVMALAESVGPRIRAGQAPQAADDAQEALSVARERDLRLYEGYALRALGEVAAAKRDFESMETHFAKACDLFADLQNATEEAETHMRWGDGLRAAMHAGDARKHLLRAEEMFSSRGMRRRAAVVRTSLVALPS
jgi:tetratricopeptide (TPR) repeat protein